MKLQSVALHHIVHSQKVLTICREMHVEHKHNIAMVQSPHACTPPFCHAHSKQTRFQNGLTAHICKQKPNKQSNFAFENSFFLVKLEWTSLSLHRTFSHLFQVSHSLFFWLSANLHKIFPRCSTQNFALSSFTTYTCIILYCTQ